MRSLQNEVFARFYSFMITGVFALISFKLSGTVLIDAYRNNVLGSLTPRNTNPLPSSASNRFFTRRNTTQSLGRAMGGKGEGHHVCVIIGRGGVCISVVIHRVPGCQLPPADPANQNITINTPREKLEQWPPSFPHKLKQSG